MLKKKKTRTYFTILSFESLLLTEKSLQSVDFLKKIHIRLISKLML